MALTLNGTTGISGIAGSAGTPALQGNNDANTGYFFAADTLGLSTAGSERLSITSAGKVGINQSSPGDLLEIHPASNNDGITIKDTGEVYPALTFDINRSGSDQFLGNIRGMWNGTTVANILLETGSDTTNKDDGVITFRTASAGTPAERLRITSAGKVGIGETTPLGNLHVKEGDSGVTSAVGQIIYRHGEGQSYANSMSFFTNAAERLRITSTGAIQSFYNSSLPVTDSRPILQLGYSTVGDDSSGRNNLACNAYPVNGDSTWHYIGSGSLAPSRYELGFGEHKWFTSSAGTRGNDITWIERLRLDNSGDLQIRCDTSAHKGLKWYSHTGNLGVSFTYGEGNANPTLNIYRQDSQSGFPYGNLIINTGSASSPTQALKLRTDKHIELAGSLIMGNGNGIDFSATSDASGKTSELLDDYEEGNLTWYLRKSDNTSGGNDNGSIVKYTKVGRLVHISGRIRTDSVSSGSTYVFHLDGSLPFTPSTPGTSVVGHWRSQDQLDSSLTASIAWGESNTTIYLYTIDSKSDYSAASNNVPASHQTNLVMTFSFTYQA